MRTYPIFSHYQPLLHQQQAGHAHPLPFAGKACGDTLNLQFSGQGTVKAHCMGSEVEIPQAVLEAAEAVKVMVVDHNHDRGEVNQGNATYLENGTFISVAHVLEQPGPTYLGHYKMLEATYIADAVEVVAQSQDLDLATLKRTPPPKHSASSPVRLADLEPQKDEILYIIGWHHKIDGLNFIPAVYQSEQLLCTPESFEREPIGKEASYFRLYTGHLKKFDSESLSGSPVLNQKGELVGILARRAYDWPSKISTGIMGAISIKTIRQFLSQINRNNSPAV